MGTRGRINMNRGFLEIFFGVSTKYSQHDSHEHNCNRFIKFKSLNRIYPRRKGAPFA